MCEDHEGPHSDEEGLVSVGEGNEGRLGDSLLGGVGYRFSDTDRLTDFSDVGGPNRL